MASIDPSLSAMPPVQEVRRAIKIRRMTTFRVGVLKIDGRRQLCIIRNISEGGARLYLYSSVALGQRVSIELKSDHHASAVVVWRQHGSVGLQFDQNIDLNMFLTAKLPSGKERNPRLPRVEVDRLGEVRAGALRYPVNSCDISQGGVRVEIDAPLTVGTDVVLTLERFHPVNGTVRWSRPGNAGIAFNKLLPFDDLLRWLEADQV